MNTRVRAIEAYLKALRTGEASATADAARHLAPNVVLDTVGAHMWGNGHEEFNGYDETVKMITGIGVMTGHDAVPAGVIQAERTATADSTKEVTGA